MINRNCIKYNFQNIEVFLRKILELYEMIIVRHGLMLVGYSYGAKTSAYKVLADALSDLYHEGLNDENITKYVSQLIILIIHFIIYIFSIILYNMIFIFKMILLANFEICI